jgi:hypothetical protein
MIMATPALSVLFPHATKDPNPMNTTNESTIQHDPFDARDLPNVLDRVVTPVTIEVNGEQYSVQAADIMWSGRVVHVFCGIGPDGDVEVHLDPTDTVELIGTVTVLDAPVDVIAYVGNGELLCADHGAPFDIGTEDGAVSPIFDGQHLDAVEWCPAGADHGHSFCGTCGTYLETTRGAHDRDLEGPFARCWNCDATSVYVDGNGFEHVNGFGDVLDTHNVTVTGIAADFQTGLDGVLRITAVDADYAPSLMRTLRTFVAWQSSSPWNGALLIMCETFEEASEVADLWAEESCDTSHLEDEEADDVLSDTRADTVTCLINVDKVEFSPKR